MILYIKALGFSEYDSKEKAEDLVTHIIEHPTDRYVTSDNEGKVKIEYYKSYGKDFGLVVRGQLDEKEELLIHTVLPYAKGRYIMDTHEIDIVENTDKHNFSGYCEEQKSGTPVSFFLQNLVDYHDIELEENVYINGVKLTAFAVEGTIILPVEKDEDEENLEIAEQMIREELLNEARDGNEDAIDALEEEALEATKVLRDRLKQEDLLTILDGFFIPVGDDADIYSILGTIKDARKLINRTTREHIWRIKLLCMNMMYDVYINEKDLVGKPTKGMRFKGTSWVHGIIDFEVISE